MSYEVAVQKAWDELAALSSLDRHRVILLGDTYEIVPKDKKAFSVSCNVPVKDYLAILLLHYLIGEFKKGYAPSGEWISFKEIEGGEFYYPAFRESAIHPLLRKYGDRPENLLKVLERFQGKKISEGDIAIEIITFKDVAVRIILWKGDEEFGPEATILFDKNITNIYTMEDIVVFSRFVTHNL